MALPALSLQQPHLVLVPRQPAGIKKGTRLPPSGHVCELGAGIRALERTLKIYVYPHALWLEISSSILMSY